MESSSLAAAEEKKKVKRSSFAKKQALGRGGAIAIRTTTVTSKGRVDASINNDRLRTTARPVCLLAGLPL